MKFKIGDSVEIDKNLVLELNGSLPEWITGKKFKIDKILPEFDDNGYPIVELNKNLANAGGYGRNLITSQYLKLTIKEDRKNKLKIINDIEK